MRLLAVLALLAGGTAAWQWWDRPNGWREDFSGPAGRPPDPARWTHQTGDGGWGNNELQRYTDDPANAHLDGAGHLVIQPLREGDGAASTFTSARIYSDLDEALTYGTVSARIKVPAGHGLWAAFWMLGTDLPEVGWPESGEIDVLETVNDASSVSVGIHGPRQSGLPWKVNRSMEVAAGGSWADDFHVYAVAWSPGLVVFTVDGTEVGRVTPDDLPDDGRWVFDKPAAVLLNVAIGGRFPAMPRPSMPPEEVTEEMPPMLVDWVEVQPLEPDNT